MYIVVDWQLRQENYYSEVHLLLLLLLPLSRKKDNLQETSETKVQPIYQLITVGLR